MNHRHSTRQKTLLHWVAVGCVAIALSLNGLAAPLVAMLGAKHVHTTTRLANADPASLVLSDFRRASHLLDTSLARVQPPHSHALFQRHHHDAGDTSVQALDAGATDDVLNADGSVAAVALVWMADGSDSLRIAEPAGTALPWQAVNRAVVAGIDPEPLDRPPKA